MRNAVSLAAEIPSRADADQPAVWWADKSVLVEADALRRGKANYFSAHSHDIGNPPNWFLNPFQNREHRQSNRHWSEVSDFGGEVGDIKAVWEMSRFSWATVLARAWRVSGDRRYLETMHLWMQDWSRHNPPNTGPNWMCGQETSIRLINSLLALQISGLSEVAISGLADFVEAHCRRVDLTTFYAVAQDNNHGTSEAACLFVGGTWLARNGEGRAKYRGQHWAEKGRKLLESRVVRLVLPDGSFSQHSVTYHRLMLDTLSIAETWRRQIGEMAFAKGFYKRAVEATRWLGAMIEPTNGEAPNLGANDGAHPFRLDESEYRDFRPSLQLASLLFIGSPALAAGPWDESSAWLGIRSEGEPLPWVSGLRSTVFADGGYVIMRHSRGARVFVRAPTTRFRPSHADALHVDLWWRGQNILRDGGTYSYAEGGAVTETLASVAGHNVQQFDGHDQMPRLGRFLYGEWLQVSGQPMITGSEDEQSWSGGYTDFWGAQQKRTVTLRAGELSVRDEVQGFKRKATLRWRLAPGDWTLNDTGCTSTIAGVKVESDVPIRGLRLGSGWESRRYLEKSVLPVLEVEIDRSPAVLTTTVSLL